MLNETPVPTAGVQHLDLVILESREYDYMPGYYAVFFYGPDGRKLEILRLPERSP